jgi:hypothetical protein
MEDRHMLYTPRDSEKPRIRITHIPQNQFVMVRIVWPRSGQNNEDNPGLMLFNPCKGKKTGLTFRCTPIRVSSEYFIFSSISRKAKSLPAVHMHSSVGIATKVQVGQPCDRCSIPCINKTFFYSPQHPDQ